MSKLISELFRGDPRLEKCLIDDAAHVLLGNQGQFVAKIQYAVVVLEGGSIIASEILQEKYGPQTAKLVKAYKARRKIINFSYQTQADDIVGKMTIERLDAEMFAFEQREALVFRRI